MSEPMISVPVSEVQTLTDPLNGEGQIQEHVGSEIIAVREADECVGKPRSELGTVEFDGKVDDALTGSVCEEYRETEVVGGEVDDSETEVGCVDGRDDDKVGTFLSRVVNGVDPLAGNEGSQVVVSNTKSDRGLVMESNEGLQDVVEVSENQSVRGRQDKGTVSSCKELGLSGQIGSMKGNSECGTTVQVNVSVVLKDQDKSSAGLISMNPDLEQGDVGVSDSADLLHDSVNHMYANLYNVDETSEHEQLNVEIHAPELKYLDGAEREAMPIDREVEVPDNGIAEETIEDSGDVSTINTEEDDSERNASPSRLEFNITDLVWGKVRSHPWWPGQIFDPSAASNKAKKYFKKDCYLVAYFGDQTFAWNDETSIKNFQNNFSQMERQSNSEDFHHAVDSALDEVCRRVEYSLACSCIPKEMYSKLNTQIIVNAGIADEYRRDGGDKYLTATSFDPIQLIDHVKSLAHSPLSGFDMLDLVIARAHLMAFYRAKGYPHLTEYKLHGMCEDDQHMEENFQEDEAVLETIADTRNEEETPSGKGPRSQDIHSHKRKTSAGGSMRANKKERTLSDLMTEHSPNMEAGEKQMSNSSGRKRKAVVGFSDDSSGQPGNCSLSLRTSKSQLMKQNFRVGDSIRRAANQLLASSPMLKCTNGISQIVTMKNTCKRKTFHKSLRDKLIQSQVFSPDEMLSQLYVTARSPMSETSLLHFMLCFFSEYHFSRNHDGSCWQDHELSLEQTCGAESGGRSNKEFVCMPDELDLLGDWYWTDRLIESIPDDQLPLVDQNGAGEFLSEPLSESGFPNVELQHVTDFSAYMLSDQDNVDRAHGLETFKPTCYLEDSYKEDVFPTELILEFTNLDLVPSEAKLNKIFSRFGALIESETEVVKVSGRAKVVFKRHADAETACNSAGKYSIFGQSEVVYRLKYIPPPSAKASDHATKRGRKIAANVEGGNGG